MAAKPPVFLGPVFLGIDTGGTYTDAVLWSEKDGILAKAKSLTTRHDLAQGIAGAVDAVLAESSISPSAIKLASMSTTLATNALVEGQGGRVALVMIGFSEAEMSRDGLKAALGTDPVIFCPGAVFNSRRVSTLRSVGRRYSSAAMRLFRILARKPRTTVSTSGSSGTKKSPLSLEEI